MSSKSRLSSGISTDLFADLEPPKPAIEVIAQDAVLLRGLISSHEQQLLHEIQNILNLAPLRQVTTPSGLKMSVTMSNCGDVGWVSDRRGYRYETRDPDTGQPWPSLPALFIQLAQNSAALAGYPNFSPDACLINRYVPGARMSLHQDKDERDFNAPIVSVSLGLPAVFLFGGLQRVDKALRIGLEHGDIVVWGGSNRLAFHGIAPLAEGQHPLLGSQRINLTFRKAH